MSEPMGLGGYGNFTTAGLPPGNGQVLKVAELITPIPVLFFTYRWIVQAQVDGLGRRWCFLGLLDTWPYITFSAWNPETSRFPYGWAVFPD